MLRNQPIKPVENDLDRRWLFDDYFDLILWYEPDGQVYGFQLCYEKTEQERALTWIRKKGFTHRGVDGGESSPFSNCTPTLVHNAEFPYDKVRTEFIARSEKLPAEIVDLVLVRLADYEKSVRGS